MSSRLSRILIRSTGLLPPPARCGFLQTGGDAIRQLVGQGGGPHAPTMFVVTEEDEAAIRAAYKQRGEFAAAVELRRRFPGITPTMRRLGSAPAPSPAGSRCHCGQ